jgi:hypothetical protein
MLLSAVSEQLHGVDAVIAMVGVNPLKDRMSAFQSNRGRSKLALVVTLLLIVIAALAGAALYLWPRLESEPPQITVSPSVDVLGVAPLEILITDKGTGLRSVTATLSQGGAERSLASEQFDLPMQEKKIVVAALAKVSGVKEGPVVLRVTARDAALWQRISRSTSRHRHWSLSPTTVT